MGPLAGLRVLDLSRILAGPWATQLLADLGAEVIKIEHPRGGDDTRRWGPPFLHDGAGNPSAESAYYLAANRGKRSVAIDFSKTEGADLVRELARHCDLLVENFRPGGLARHRLDWPSLQSLNPRLVYCSITGYGQHGPNAQRAGYDAAIQAEGGLMSLTGDAEGGPQKVGVAVVDLMTGMYAATGMLAALRHAEATGEGQHIDLALYDTQVAMLANQAMNYLVGGQVPARLGTAHPNIVPYQVMPARNGHFMLAVGNDAQFARLCALVDRSALADDPRFATNSGRVAHRQSLVPALEAAFLVQPVEHWVTTLSAAGIPCAPVNGLDSVFAGPQAEARELRREIPHPLHPALPLVANPLRLSASPVEFTHAPPLLGADTREVLQLRLALDDGTLERLQEQGVIHAA
ncbi:CaiB/BaiF CoA transferase family protein [Pseudomarimonas salicorniae]|uniref:CoA transferase n=1 Tax=Pseudomarimonas salicorniae TaxID=2933270 RepID=A0ABT0GKG4_9GAMM|nr:CaiB/BaiF CoA-transferase family protein [Lysobacter sp. CAU 1642]MCK7594537.1 CoA transferase [Lysobacter sp. CAU 1642]